MLDQRDIEDELFRHHYSICGNYEQATAAVIQQMRGNTMSEKEKYLSIRMTGHTDVYAFKNKDRDGNQPHYKGDGVAVWVNERKPKEEKIPEEDL